MPQGQMVSPVCPLGAYKWQPLFRIIRSNKGNGIKEGAVATCLETSAHVQALSLKLDLLQVGESSL